MSKHKAIPQMVRKRVYEKYGERCAYCGCNLEYKDMQVDHVNPVYIHNDINSDMSDEEMNDISNLFPTCRQCNFYKSTLSIDSFRVRLQTVMMDNLRKQFNYRLALKYGIIKENNVPIRFYFEKVASRY